MNTSIQILNDWGESFLNFAWPMLWQSSLLIAIVFACDAMLARRIRAAVRYALWLAVLVKLLLPPALALPTSAAWWLWPAKPALAPVINSEVVSFDAPVVAPSVSIPETIPFVPLPPPELSGAGWAMLGYVAVGTGLLSWLAIRWLRVAAKVRRASASNDFAPALQDARQCARLRHCPRLKLVDDVQSPAVYGLFRPVILLPRALAEKLSTRQLRAVLLHEATHLRRGDVWVHCAQTLLQIAYWWHPLLWLANARIRHLREEAVDDAVMLALRGDADAYAPTLLEVAKFSFRRPLTGLALIGILESRSKLRRRIERLVDFRPPRKAGLSFLSLCGILAFCAVTLPMGCGRAPEQAAHKNHWPDPHFEGIRFVNLTARFLILNDGQLKAADPSLADNASPTLLSPEETTHFLRRLQENGARSFYEDWSNGILQPQVSGAWQYYEIGGSTNGLNMIIALTNITCSPFSELFDGWRIQTLASQPDWTTMNFNLRALVQDDGTRCQMDLSFPNTGDPALHSEIILPTDDTLVWVTRPGAPGKCQVIFLTPTFNQQLNGASTQPAPVAASLGRKVIYQKLDRIHVNGRTSLNELPLSEVIQWLREQSQLRDPDKTGINFNFQPNVPAASNMDGRTPQINPATGLPVSTPANSPPDDTQINVTLQATNMSLADLLNAILCGTDHPIKYSVEDYGVVFAAKDPDLPKYEMRTFKLGTNVFFTNLGKVIGRQINSSNTDVSDVLKQLFEKKGVDLSSPKQVYYNPRLGILFVYATEKDLGVIEHIVQILHSPFAEQHGLLKFITNHSASSGTGAGDGISEQTESALNQALVEERKEAHLELVAQAKVNSSPTPNQFNRLTMSLTEANQPNSSVFSTASLPTHPVNSVRVPFSPIINPITGQPIFGTQASALVDSNGLETKTFGVGATAFFAAVRKRTGETNIITGFKELAAQAGVDLSPPKNIGFTDNAGVLRVDATTNDLKIISRLLVSLNCPPPMIHIKSRFFEVPEEFFTEANSLTASLTNGGVLTLAHEIKLLRQLKSYKGTEELAEPEVTTICGRQTEMRATIIQPVVTNYVVNPYPTNRTDNVTPQVGQIETGSILDVVPMCLQDGYTLDLRVIPSEIDFLGYADTKGLPKRTAIDSSGAKIELPNVLPRFKVYETTLEKTFYDGQTLVLAPTAQQMPPGMDDENWSERVADLFRTKKEEDKVLLVLVTATLIDAAGNRVHSNDQMPFPPNQVP